MKKQPEKPAETEQKPPPKKKPEPEDIYPLTGKPADHHVENRPFGVMINNAPKARPQSGVYKADIVYEVLAEGAITRFLALFQSQQPEIIGPVRSARPYFVKLNNAYDAIYVHHGWSPQARELIKSTDTDNINGLYYDGTLFHRVDFRNAPHNSYIPYENIIKGAKENDYPLKADIDPLPFLDPEEASSLTGEKATEVTIDYLDRYQVRFVYQPDTETYLRYSEGEKSIDRETKTPITVANVFIVAAPHRYIDSYPRRGINLQDGGKAMLFQKGTVRKLKWKNVEGRIVPVHNGKTVGFVPGQTWVNIIPADPGLAGSVKVTGRDENAN
ncbi:MAG TPA: DUF3048 domain-containing protein [Bacillales bacterium]|nr:DUF3048 domain-containing protein [Bacillales bacterium]